MSEKKKLPAHEVLLERLRAMVNMRRALDDETSKIVGRHCQQLLIGILRDMEIPEKHRQSVAEQLVKLAKYASAEGEEEASREIEELADEINT